MFEIMVWYQIIDLVLVDVVVGVFFLLVKNVYKRNI